jgi:UDP-4-amino-4,6-dideoxy-N-acetyl-beta-L-altrosamine transaminase
MIPYARQDIQDDDIAAVIAVLRSDYLTQGPAVPAFENAVSAVVHAGHAVATCNATAALHIAYLALDLGPGDWLWTVPNTFVATANAALYCGAYVDFVDIDPRTYNISIDALRSKLDHAERRGRLPKIVVPVHYAGQSCELREIHQLSKQYGFCIVEDASHAIGGSYLDEPIGNCRFSEIAVFSFHPVKIIATGEGGMAVTNRSELAVRMQRLRTHGITRDAAQMGVDNQGPWYYQQIELGLNYRMTDIQAALGFSQLARLQQYVVRRHELARRYDKGFANLPVTVPYRHPDSHSATHLYPIWIDPQFRSRADVFNALRADGVGVNVHYIPVHTQPYYRAKGFKWGYLPNAERYYEGTISLPMFPSLTELDQDHVIAGVRRALA